jgi:hypothetical protein
MTAEEFLDANTSGIIDELKCKELMIEFAKYHVEQALKEIHDEFKESVDSNLEEFINIRYPLENIK